MNITTSSAFHLFSETKNSLRTLEEWFPTYDLGQDTTNRPNVHYFHQLPLYRRKEDLLAVVYELLESITSGARYHLVATSKARISFDPYLISSKSSDIEQEF
jgi:hypothetical protein